MKRQRLPGEWFRRSLRRAGFDRNPMRRATDRIQAITWAALLVVFLAGAPAAASGAGHAIYVSGLQAARAQAAAWHPVAAVVLRMTPVVTGWSLSRPSPAQLSARWTSPSGSPRTGEITGVWDTVAGRTMTVWVDHQGRLTSPPLSRAQIAARAAAGAAAAAAAVALLLILIGKAVSVLLDKRRLAAWEADWSTVEPHWTGRK
jgi:hypothetical protein